MLDRTENESFSGLEVAVIGMAGKFPGAKNVNEFWENLINGVESISFFTDDELLDEGVNPELLKNPAYVKAGGFLEDKMRFDSFFFGYSFREAELMSPQMRILHECVWSAFEDAGYVPYLYPGKIGFYAGASSSSYWEILSQFFDNGVYRNDPTVPIYTDKDQINMRISYNLNLTGPSLAINTACSTSLVAIHMACQGILSGDCDMALAGGCSLVGLKKKGYLCHGEGAFSPEGRCKAFDAGANGIVICEGAGIVLLKPLTEAMADNDYIYAVIKGSAVNNDGRAKIGYTAPSVQGQAALISEVLDAARVSLKTIGYIETHGTGTTIGDPIEFEALKSVFGTDKKKVCAIGSVKTNIGHLVSAAGVAAFIKAALAVKYRVIPTSLHFKNPNPKLDIESSPFFVVTELTPWNNNGGPLRAGVSSFGIGGTNAHVILEEPPGIFHHEAKVADYRSQHLIILSAKTQTALQRSSENLVEYLKNNPGTNLADVAYTLQVGRESFPYRRIAVGGNGDEVVEALTNPEKQKVENFLSEDNEPLIVFMFPGGGSQYVNMGSDLYKTEAVFREEMNRCFNILRPLMGFDVKEVIYPSPEHQASPSPIPDINHSEGILSLLFALEYALAKLLLKWGIKPYTLIGHSLGEYTAACLAGVFSLEDALKLLVTRGRLMLQLPVGSMLSVSISVEQLKSLLDEHGDPDICIAAVNNPSRCVVSATTTAIDSFRKFLKEKRVGSLPFNVSRASHSKMIEPILREFESVVKKIKLNKPQIPYISNLSGQWIKEDEATNPIYFVEHFRRTVRFADGINELLNTTNKNIIFVEVGPGNVLSTFVKPYADLDKKNTRHIVNLVRHPQKEVTDNRFLLEKIGRLWLLGKKPDWTSFYQGEKRRRIPLPTYPFEGQYFCFDDNLLLGNLVKKSGDFLPLMKPDMADWFYIPSWERSTLETPGNVDQEGSSCWLIFIDTCGPGSSLVKRIEANGGEVITVEIGPGFNKAVHGKYILNPTKENDYKNLFKELKKLKKIPSRIVHLWSVTGNDHKKSAFELEDFDIEVFQDIGLFSLLNLAQAIGEEGFTDEIKIAVVIDNMQEVTGEEQLCPVKAPVLGAVKAIPLEYPNIKCTGMDIVVPAPGSPLQDKITEFILEEFKANFSHNIIAFRGYHRWIKSLKPYRMEKKTGTAQRLKNQGVYLITGGLEGGAFILAEYLATFRKARLFLVEQTFFPHRKEWKKWLASHHETDNVSLNIRRLLEWEKKGAQIIVEQADINDLQQMKEIIVRALELLGPLDGVIHAGWNADNEDTIQQRTRVMIEKEMAPKIRGTLVLDALLKDLKLDFFVLLSPEGNVLHKLGGDRVGDNASHEFFNTYACFKSYRKGTFTTAISWNIANEEDKNGEVGTLDYSALVDVFERILEHDQVQVIVSDKDIELMLQRRDQKFDKKTGEEKKLPNSMYQRPNISTEYTAPKSDLEKNLVRIWQKFFTIEQVGIRDDFFELGGDSLKATTIVDLVHRDLGVKVPLAEMFKTPTIREMASYISGAVKDEFIAIEPVEEKEYYALSAAQKRLYVVQQIDPDSIGYNLYLTVILEGGIDKDKLSTAFYDLIKRHDSLRTSFFMVGEDTVQKIQDEVDFQIEYYDVSQFESEVRGEEREKKHNPSFIIEDFIRPFDLAKAPMMRVGLIKLNEKEHILVVDMNHIITDGVSTEVLKRDFILLYSKEQLPTLKLQYKDFSEWQNTAIKKELLEKQEKYWIQKFKGEIPILNFPTDYNIPEKNDFEGAYVKSLIPDEISLKVEALIKETDTTLFMFLLAAFNILLTHYTGQHDIVMGSPITGRNHIDLQNIIGMFINMLALRNRPEKAKTFIRFLKEVQQNVLDAFENQDYQFDELVRNLRLERKSYGNPLFDIVLAMQNYDTSEFERVFMAHGEQLKLRPYGINAASSRFYLTLFVRENNEKINIIYRYSTSLFKEETIKKLGEHYIEIIDQVTDNPDIKLEEIILSSSLLDGGHVIKENDVDFDF